MRVGCAEVEEDEIGGFREPGGIGRGEMIGLPNVPIWQCISMKFILSKLLQYTSPTFPPAQNRIMHLCQRYLYLYCTSTTQRIPNIGLAPFSESFNTFLAQLRINFERTNHLLSVLRSIVLEQ